ncbi:MAG: carbohydrate-binding protein [Clostridia bacterium]|nr:carbohydrate-binding protein [Clostridia bacterium]
MEKNTLKLKVVNGNGHTLLTAADDTNVSLVYTGEYKEGDSIVLDVDVPCYCMVQFEDSLPAALVYVGSREVWYHIPFGSDRIVFSPKCFVGSRHLIRARLAEPYEIAARRNLAFNPYDQHGDEGCFPHSKANVETRGEAVFASYNAIDGICENASHGEWPYQSWGIGAREDAWCLLDFGREVDVDEMALTLRADFPHDAYWVSGHVVLSDGAEIAYDLQKTGDRQFIALGKHTVRWMRLERMQKSDDPSAFPALIEWEVFGAEKA